jgi:C_GCAxxG_C_C family probable redox protein
VLPHGAFWRRRVKEGKLKGKNEQIYHWNLEELVGIIRLRAQNLFETHQLFCSEAVLHVLNQGLGGGLPPDTAIRIASGFSDGIGGAGCTCGAFSGAIMALGLFLGRQGIDGRDSKKVQVRGKALHDRFRSRFGSTCCRVLTKKVRNDHKALYKACTHHTGEAAELAARIILEARPDLIRQADWDFLSIQDSSLKAGLNRLLTLVQPGFHLQKNE